MRLARNRAVVTCVISAATPQITKTLRSTFSQISTGKHATLNRFVQPISCILLEQNRMVATNASRIFR